VAWLGREYFAGSLPALGWRVRVHSFKEPAVFTWADILALCGGEPPAALVLGDRSLPPPFLGLESFPCATVFYSVDSHIHAWHPLYAQAFDACLAGLGDHLARFARGRLGAARVLWSPAYALDARDMPWSETPPRWDVLFAGAVDPETTPRRADFLARLGRLLPELEVRQGHFTELFPLGRVILNVAERGDLNFRVFEALAMARPLLTPATGNGLLDLFADGETLVTYAPDDAADCAAKARQLLAHPGDARRMGLAGLAAVDAAHRASHRARAFSDFLLGILAQGPAQRLADAGAIHASVLRPLHLHAAEASPDPALRDAYMADALRRA